MSSAVQTRTQLYRDPLAKTQVVQNNNIMHDPRVFRGSVGGVKPLTQAQREAELQTTMKAPSRPSKQQLIDAGLIRAKPPTVAQLHANIVVVKQRVPIPTELYLVEASKPSITLDADSQTDDFLEEPPSPSYIPRKIGADVGTQVDTAQVFVFDVNVENLLENIVGKTLEQAEREVRQEEERRSIKEHREELEEKERKEEKRIEEQEIIVKKAYQEKERLLATARQQHIQSLQVRSKLNAAFFSRSYLASLEQHVVDSLSRQHFFHDIHSTCHQLDTVFLPHMMNDIDLRLHQYEGVKQIVQEMMIEGMQQQQHANQLVLLERARRAEEERVERERQQAIADELARRQAKIQLFIHTDLISASPVGPINLTGESTIADIESRVWSWFERNSDELPDRARIRFLWNNEELKLDNNTQIYDMGMNNLTTLTMEMIPLPEPVEEEKTNENEGAETPDDEEDDDDTV